MPPLEIPPLTGRWPPFVLPLALIVAGLLALVVDIPLARWLLDANCPSFVKALLQAAGLPGHGIGVLLVAVAIWRLDGRRRWAVPRLLAAALGSGMAANVVKLLVARLRPHHLTLDGGTWIGFDGWFPLGLTESSHQSFPSAHTATAVGLAVALAWLYPRQRRIFFVLAVLVACQRIISGAHFLSDTLWGAAIGLFIAAACLGSGPVARWFRPLEDRWKLQQVSGTLQEGA